MSGPWFIETLARNGDVLQRSRVDALPIRLGRGYDNDFIIDDDYVAASHARIEMDAAGRLVLRDQGSRNGIIHRGKRLPEVVLSGDTVVRIGHTSLRVRAASFPVAPELADRTFHRWEGALPGAAGVLLTGCFALFARWLSDTQYFEFVRYFEALAWGVGAALLWSGAWAFANRLFGRHARLGRHLFVFGCGLAALAATALLAATIAYAFSLEAFTHYASHAATLLVAGMIYFHLCTVKPQNRRRYRWIAAGMAVLGSSLILIFNLQRSGRLADELYMAVLLPPEVRVSQDHGIDEFMREVEGMKESLDRGRGRKPGEDELED
ncbi:FHA domain-containing protein [Massilia norwichensis]|uniref:FHA domain-containing protein n=1 Tax=Massilia norwichensis TaxID=1442366 RepID=A0ABT2AC20_9BURK|nr:FHA domain-containing protein [Massilia norwichensis]MCS0591754.1 FHA domain-containing protein [Massilia norwichensis]